jgi:hypothetical protein
MNSMCNLIVSRYVKCKQKYDNYEDIYGNCQGLFNLLKICVNNFPDDDD